MRILSFFISSLCFLKFGINQQKLFSFSLLFLSLSPGLIVTYSKCNVLFKWTFKAFDCVFGFGINFQNFCTYFVALYSRLLLLLLILMHENRIFRGFAYGRILEKFACDILNT